MCLWDSVAAHKPTSSDQLNFSLFFRLLSTVYLLKKSPIRPRKFGRLFCHRSAAVWVAMQGTSRSILKIQLRPARSQFSRTNSFIFSAIF
jgi:hypothetical protein